MDYQVSPNQPNPHLQKQVPSWLGILIVVVAGIIAGTAIIFFQLTTVVAPLSPQTQIQSSNSDIASWKTYKNDIVGYEFKYPESFSISNDFGVGPMSLTYNDEGKQPLWITLENADTTLEKNVNDYVVREQNYINTGTSAAPLSATYRPHAIGNLEGYLITRQAADVLRNTDAIFKTQRGNRIYSFSYSYQDSIFDDPATLVGGGPVPQELFSEIQMKVKVYNQIQAIISSFTFTKSVDPLDVMPLNIGECVKTNVIKIGTRIFDGTTGQDIPGSGSAIYYSNGGSQVSYSEIEGVVNSRVGDKVNLCLLAVPTGCPPGDNRGKYYGATNIRTGEKWEASDSQHMCGGA